MAEKVLEKCRVKLRDGLTEAVIKSLSDDLRDKNVLGKEEIEEILHKTKTRTDQARDLIDNVVRKGQKSSEILLECLEKRDKRVYELLNTDSYSAIQEAGATSSHPSVMADKPNTTTEEEYKMDSNPRGICVIINNENFKDPKRKRNGSQKDVERLKYLFEYLGFLVEIKKDQTTSEIKNLMIGYSKDHRHADCFVCCVMSHGNENGVEGCDEQTLPMKDITSPFDGVNCSSLIGKPKLFFIQACRGREMQSKVLVADGPGSSRMQPSDIKYSIAKDSDFLMAMSTVEGYMSIRDTNNGSWFIQSLCNRLEDGSKLDQDINTILTKVNYDVSGKDGIIDNVIDAKMSPGPSYTLRKRLVFRAPKAPASK